MAVLNVWYHRLITVNYYLSTFNRIEADCALNRKVALK
jgi:hypothetical protein